jgi:hypothetical protein
MRAKDGGNIYDLYSYYRDGQARAIYKNTGKMFSSPQAKLWLPILHTHCVRNGINPLVGILTSFEPPPRLNGIVGLDPQRCTSQRFALYELSQTREKDLAPIPASNHTQRLPANPANGRGSIP